MPRDLDDWSEPRTPRIPLASYRDYKVKVEPLPCESWEYQEYYWHLFYKGQKINGGIMPTPELARERASLYQYDHQRQIWLRNHVWDEEYRRWDNNVIV